VDAKIATPPKVGVFLIWELLSPGSAIRFFKREILIITGIAATETIAATIAETII
jgi:hypothetical protein